MKHPRCAECDEPIPAARLRANPTATMCRDCADAFEKMLDQSGHGTKERAIDIAQTHGALAECGEWNALEAISGRF